MSQQGLSLGVSGRGEGCRGRPLEKLLCQACRWDEGASPSWEGGGGDVNATLSLGQLLAAVSSSQDKAHDAQEPAALQWPFCSLHQGGVDLAPCEDWTQGEVAAGLFSSLFPFYPRKRIDVACQGTACSVGDMLVRRSSSERLSVSSKPFASSVGRRLLPRTCKC